jgi:hypothetical protein
MCFRAFWRTTLFFAVPGFLSFTLTFLRGQWGGDRNEPLEAGTLVTALLVYAGMSLFYVLAPKVLWELALLAVLVGALFLLATVLTLVISLPVLGWSLVKRMRARHRFVAPDAQPAIQG